MSLSDSVLSVQLAYSGKYGSSSSTKFIELCAWLSYLSQCHICTPPVLPCYGCNMMKGQNVRTLITLRNNHERVRQHGGKQKYRIKVFVCLSRCITLQEDIDFKLDRMRWRSTRIVFCFLYFMTADELRSKMTPHITLLYRCCERLVIFGQGLV